MKPHSQPSPINSSVTLEQLSDDPHKFTLIDSLEHTPGYSKALLMPYLESLWKSLSLQSDTSIIGVRPSVFIEFAGLPGLIGERFFNLVDRDKDGALKMAEFQFGLSRLFAASFEAKVELVFDFYDFNEDGYITPEDIRMLLSHVTLAQLLEPHASKSPKEGKFTKDGGGLDQIRVLYMDRLQSQEELVYHISKFMGGMGKIGKKDFLRLTETVSSTIFLCLFMLIRAQCKIYKHFADYCGHKVAPQKHSNSPNPVSKKLLPSPQLPAKTKLSPLIPLYSVKKKSLFSKHERSISILQKLAMDDEKSMVGDEEMAKSTIVHEGYLYERSPISEVPIKYWYRLVDNHLYRYLTRDSVKEDRMLSLSGCFVKNELPEKPTFRQIAFPSFTIWIGQETVKLYAPSLKEREAWLKAIREILGSGDITDFYDFKEPLGAGSFGIVKAAIHRITGEKVAIKILSKKQLSGQKLDLAKQEIEILKTCQHRNIIRLIDVFETVEHIYIVMEFIEGKSLREYLESRNYNITESRGRSIIHSLATALYYLHSFGIIHRDLKTDNVLMINESDDSDIKIVDFGLSKMVGPEEKCKEPFGTFGYVAPEVLLGKEYTKAVDIWTLGVIAYILLSGVEPFDAPTEAKIGEKTIKADPSYTRGKWRTVSFDAKHLVKKMLVKDVEFRITLKKVLTDPWLIDDNSNLELLRNNATEEVRFKVFSQKEPHSVKMFDEVHAVKSRILSP